MSVGSTLAPRGGQRQTASRQTNCAIINLFYITVRVQLLILVTNKCEIINTAHWKCALINTGHCICPFINGDQ